MAEWVPFTEASLLNTLPLFVVDAYNNWIGVHPEKAARLGEIVAQVRTVFREAVAANPRNAMDVDEDTVPAVAVQFAADMAAHTLWVEIGDFI